MVKRPKVVVSLSIEMDDLELLDEIMVRVRAKSRSVAFHALVHEWQTLADERKMLREKVGKLSVKRPINPMVNP